MFGEQKGELFEVNLTAAVIAEHSFNCTVESELHYFNDLTSCQTSECRSNRLFDLHSNGNAAVGFQGSVQKCFVYGRYFS